MVQNFAHFQQYCHPGAKGNHFADTEAVPRCEAACAICAKKDFLEHRHKLNLFAEPPAQNVSELAGEEENATEDMDEEGAPTIKAPIARTRLMHKGVYYIQSPGEVHKLLDVARYAQRWPLIPAE